MRADEAEEPVEIERLKRRKTQDEVARLAQQFEELKASISSPSADRASVSSPSDRASVSSPSADRVAELTKLLEEREAQIRSLQARGEARGSGDVEAAGRLQDVLNQEFSFPQQQGGKLVTELG